MVSHDSKSDFPLVCKTVLKTDSIVRGKSLLESLGYFKIIRALAIILEHMHEKFEINQTDKDYRWLSVGKKSGNPQF